MLHEFLMEEMMRLFWDMCRCLLSGRIHQLFTCWILLSIKFSMVRTESKIKLLNDLLGKTNYRQGPGFNKSNQWFRRKLNLTKGKSLKTCEGFRNFGLIGFYWEKRSVIHYNWTADVKKKLVVNWCLMEEIVAIVLEKCRFEFPVKSCALHFLAIQVRKLSNATNLAKNGFWTTFDGCSCAISGFRRVASGGVRIVYLCILRIENDKCRFFVPLRPGPTVRTKD